MKMREDRWWDIPAVLCFFAALLITSSRVESTEWAPEFVILKWLTIIGFILGMGMGYSKFKSPFIRFLTFCYSVCILPWLILLTDASTLPWSERAINLAGRYNASLYRYFNNILIDDPLLFITLISTIIWLTAILGGYSIIRHGKPWIALIISGITIFVTEFYYVSDNSLFTAAFVVFSLVLLSQTNFMHSVKKWRSKGTLVDFETEFNIGRSALIVGFLLVLFVWNLSSVVKAFSPGSTQQRKVTGFFEQIRNEFIKITTPLQGPLLLEQEFYGDTIGLGTGAILGDDIIFEIEANRFKPLGTRYYWRARTYDQYSNYQWTNSINNEIEYFAGDESSIYRPNDELPERIFTFHPKINLGLLYTPIYPLEINRNATLIASTDTESGLDLIAVTTESTIYSGESYQVRAYLDNPTIYEMQESSMEYPEWISDHYLQLPSDFPTSIRQLAEEVTKDEENPYDKTFAITMYLRNNIEYQEQIPTAPNNQDPIEWFLFDLKQGFCNYYASAEVVMLRSIGIPARMVFGYAQGEENDDEFTYTVRRKQAHAWPEVYFNEIGWVEFEPTAGQPVLSRLVGLPSSGNNQGLGEELPGPEQFAIDNFGGPFGDDLSNIENIDVGETTEEALVINLIDWLPFLFGILIIDLILLISIRNKRLGYSFKAPMHLERFFEKRGWKTPNWLSRWSYYVQLSDYQRAFSSIAWSLFFLGQPVSESATPSDLVKQFSKLMPTLQTKADQLLVEYQRAYYGSYQPDSVQMQIIGKEIIKETMLNRVKKWFIAENPQI